MSALKQWAFSICLACVVAGIVKMIAPEKEMKKVVAFAINIFFVSCLVVPILGIDLQGIDYPADTTTQNESTSQTNEYILQRAKQAIEEEIGQVLKQEGISWERIEVLLHITQDNRIDCKEITIESNENAIQIKQLIYDQLGLSVQVKNED